MNQLYDVWYRLPRKAVEMLEENIKNLNYDKLGRMLDNARKIVDDLREGKNEEYIICIFNKEYVYRDGDLFFNGKKF